MFVTFVKGGGWWLIVSTGTDTSYVITRCFGGRASAPNSSMGWFVMQPNVATLNPPSPGGGSGAPTGDQLSGRSALKF